MNNSCCRKDLELLGRFANYRTNLSWASPRAYFFQEHRMAIPVIYAARQDGLFGDRSPLLVRLDAHTDFAEENRTDYKAKRSRIRNIEDCFLYANSLRADNGSWVEDTVQFGWVADVVNLFIQEGDCIEAPIPDVDDIQHKVMLYPDLTALAPEELDIDPAPLVALLSLLGLLQPREQTSEELPIWLDIDLDFAIDRVRGPNFLVRSVEEFCQWLSQPIKCIPLPVTITAQEVISRLLRKAKLVTIASEPYFTRGFANIATILAGLRSAFPEHEELFTWYEEKPSE